MRTPGSADRLVRSAGTARGNKLPATAAATDGRTGTSKPVSNSIFASAWALASSTRCKRAALHELCWFDSNPMHQSMVSVVQSARTPECDSGGRGFEPRPSPQFQFRRRLGFETPVLPWRAGSRAGGGADRLRAHSSTGQSSGIRLRRFEVRLLVSAPVTRGRRQAAEGTGLSSRHPRVRIPSSAPAFAVGFGSASQPASSSRRLSRRSSSEGGRVHHLAARIRASQAWHAGSSPAGRTRVRMDGRAV